MGRTVRCALSTYANIWAASDEKKPSIDPATNVVGIVGIDSGLAEGGRGGKLAPIAFISSMTVLITRSQMALAPVDGIVMTVELVQQAPDILAEPEHRVDDDGRVEVRDGVDRGGDDERV